MSTGRDPQQYGRVAARERAVMRRTIAGVAVMAAIAGGAVITARAQGGDETSPAGTVRAFLTSAFDGDGFGACNLLTDRARVEVERAVGESDTPCEVAMPFARLTLGGDHVTDEAAVKGLDYRVVRRGGSVSVTVTAGRARHAFRLKKAGRAQLDEFRAPPTPWRIDAGVASLVRR